MNESKNQAAMLYRTVPVVASLNHVKGFDPLKLLRRTRSPQTGEPVLKLDLRYKRLWFRLACPKGRLRLNALRITEQIAIFEAKVYRNMEDSEPISSYIAECNRNTTPGGLYVEAAQSEALNTALSNAGFGIQFADVVGGEDVYGSEIPADATPLILDVVPAGPEQETAARLPTLRAQLRDVNKRIGNLVSAIEEGVASATTRQRLDELEQQRTGLETSICQEEMKHPELAKDQILQWLQQIKNLDLDDLRVQRQVVDCFVNSIYLFDDKLIINFNFGDETRQVTLQEVQEMIKASVYKGYKQD